MVFRFLTLLSFAAIAGCTAPGPRQMYDGPRLPADRVAVIQLPKGAHQRVFALLPESWLNVLALDGNGLRVEDGRPSEIHVLPGRRRLTVAVSYGNFDFTFASNKYLQGQLAVDLIGNGVLLGDRKPFERDLEFDAMAGRVYAIKYAIDSPHFVSVRKDWRIDCWIEDLATGKIVAHAAN